MYSPLQRMVHCCTLESLRDILNGQDPNLTQGLFMCLLLGPAHFVSVVQAAVTPPAALFSATTASRLPPAALQAFLERLQAVAVALQQGGAKPRSPPRPFESAIYAFYLAAVTGDLRMLTQPQAEDLHDPNDEEEEDWSFAFEDQQAYYNDRDS